MLGLEEASELLVRDLDREVTERLPDETRVLDLLDRAGDPEERLEVLPEVGANLVRRRQVGALQSASSPARKAASISSSS